MFSVRFILTWRIASVNKCWHLKTDRRLATVVPGWHSQGLRVHWAVSPPSHLLLGSKLIEHLLNLQFPVFLHGMEGLLGHLCRQCPFDLCQLLKNQGKRRADVRVLFPAFCNEWESHYFPDSVQLGRSPKTVTFPIWHLSLNQKSLSAGTPGNCKGISVSAWVPRAPSTTSEVSRDTVGPACCCQFTDACLPHFRSHYLIT